MNFLSAMSGFFGGYHFNPVAQPLSQQNAQRAALVAFQTYPENSLQGGGTATRHNQVKINQPAQVYIDHNAMIASILGGGVAASTLYSTPLTPNPDSSGLS